MYSRRRLAVLVAAFTFIFSPAVALSAASPIVMSTEARVRAYFWDLPVMSAIAKCESEFMQFNSEGAVLRGGYRKSMIGIFQVAPLHTPKATALGIDIKTVEGNMAFARHLYEESGTRPWLASRSCWQHLPETSMKVDDATKIAMIQKQIDSIRLALEQLQ